VSVGALKCFSAFAATRKLSAREISALSSHAAPLLLHPYPAVRFGGGGVAGWSLTRLLAALAVFSSIAQTLSRADVRIYVFPSLQPFLDHEVVDVNSKTLTESLKPPVHPPPPSHSRSCCGLFLTRRCGGSSPPAAACQ
jgi:hypothetical protein